MTDSRTKRKIPSNTLVKGSLLGLVAIVAWSASTTLPVGSPRQSAVADTSGRVPAIRTNARSALGINLSGVVDYSSEMVFVDVFKHSRPWVSQQVGKAWGQGPELDLSETGWVRSLKPGQQATTLMCTEGGHPSGRYVCLYEGQGELDFQGNATVVHREAGRIEIDVSAKPGLILHLRRTDVQDPVRGIRVIMPGFENTYQAQVFYPPFLERYRPFRTLRFMDWMGTNNSEIREWSDRPRSDDARQSVRGVALEAMIDLANRLDADAWFCMPHLASDAFVHQFAVLVRDQLDPDLRVYVEHSNEVWNHQFGQAAYAVEQGRKQGLSDDPYQAQLFYHAQRSLEIFSVFEDVFGGTDRLVRVLGSQAANAWVSEQIVTFEKAYRHADAVAIAPYFGNALGSAETAEEVSQYTLQQVVDHCKLDIETNGKRIRRLVSLAKPYGLHVIAYEGGQHLVGTRGAENNEKLNQLFIAANRDPRMKDLYRLALKSWKDNGGQLFTVFAGVARPSKWGSWGLLEYEGQPISEAPKYQAVLDFIRTDPRWWNER